MTRMVVVVVRASIPPPPPWRRRFRRHRRSVRPEPSFRERPRRPPPPGGQGRGGPGRRGGGDAVEALLGGGTEKAAAGGGQGLSPLGAPHVLVLQTSPDDVGSYNSLMNCAFSAARDGVVVDGLYLPYGSSQVGSGASASDPDADSPLLHQLTDLTSGIYMPPPKGPAQVGGGLLQILLTVYLGLNVPADTAVNRGLHAPELPAREGGAKTVREVLARVVSQKVDFRGRCFKSGEIVDVGVVCNLCLSVFKADKVGRDEEGRRMCFTCGSVVVEEE